MQFPLEFYRQMAGMSQVDVANKTGLTRAAISMLESGKRGPTFATAIKLAIALGCTLDELAGTSAPKSKAELRAENNKLKIKLEQIRKLSA